MASQEDTDDLYADLYGGDGSGTGDVVDLGGDDKAHGSDEQDLIGYDEDDNKNNNSAINNGDSGDKADEKPSGAPSSGSFIPPPSSAPSQQADTGLQIKGSFIPPPAANNQAHSQSDVRDLTPASHNDASANQQHASHDAIEGNRHDSGADAERSENKAVMPHEMPEEGKMFVGGLNWDTTEDSLRRYFSQFGEVGHCTIMRDQLTGRSRGFAFLNFVDPKAVNTVMVREHYLDGKIDPKRAIPRPQHNNNHGGHQGGGGMGGGYGGGGGGGGNYSAQEQKLFVGGLPTTVTPESFRRFFEQYGTLLNCTCMMDRETGKPRGFGFLTYAEDSALERVLSTRPIVMDGKEVDVKRAQSKNDPQSLQMRRQQRMDNPGMMQQQGGRYGMGTGSNNYNVGGGGNYGGGNNGWGMNNPMMMMGAGGAQGGGFDPNAMAQMYQSMGWNNQNWNPQMAWQQMMASMTGQGGGAANAGGMDMGAMMNSMGMGMMGAMGNMSPPMVNSMSPTMGSAAANNGAQQQQQGRGSSSGPSGGDDRSDRGGPASSSRYQRGGSNNAGGSRPPMQQAKQGGYDDHARSPRGNDDRNGSHRRERSPNRRDDNRRYDNGNRNNRY
ncbi:related to HRP1 - subunit of cleavage factor I [Ustilago trichophora]|uniref:Related to HRP1 - subunit of cleavage factor I n=1 Tax=Ustilago trichophora TaxID=86804 RepID=A0A5C3EQY9_9BASI|nr:related to HRP1 - subunit of cleavage factor I [Ustilago trichophora]